MDLDTIRSRIAEHGLSYRGAFHVESPRPREREREGPIAERWEGEGNPSAETLILVGFIGSENWPTFTTSPEATDGQPDPLDRWSTRVITAVAQSLGATPLFPFDGPPYLPFQRWAQKAEPVHPSPLGILIHPDWGLWHAYRGALAFAERIDLPPPDLSPSPCDSCAGKPCLSACPVDAFSPAGYDVHACVIHIAASTGAECMSAGCLARRACPIGPDYRHNPAQAWFHQQAFLASQRSNAAEIDDLTRRIDIGVRRGSARRGR
jgi:ferredoxin